MIIDKILPSMEEFFTWKLIRNLLLTRNKLRHSGIDVVRDCSFCGKEVETIDYLLYSMTYPIIFGPLLVITVLLQLIQVNTLLNV